MARKFCASSRSISILFCGCRIAHLLCAARMMRNRAHRGVAVRHVCVRRFATGLNVSPSRTNRVSIGRTQGPMPWLRWLSPFAGLAVALLLWAEDADARLEGGPSLSKSTEGILLSPPVAAPALAV